MRLRTRLHRHAERAACAAALLALAWLPMTPARAGAPVPDAPQFSALIDPYARYEAETSCSPTEKPGAQALRDLLRTTYPSISSNIVRVCSPHDSGHEEGRALDWMTDVRVASQRDMATAFLGWLQATDQWGNPHAMVRRLGIQYIIWNNRMWRAYDPGRGWTEYQGCLAKEKSGAAYDNDCHRNHVHVSFSWDGAYQRTSYFSGYVACPAPSPLLGSAPALSTQGLDFVPLPASRLLGTASGIGSPTGACRVRSGTPYDVKVLGRGGVPKSGVAAVVLRVSLYRPDSSTSLRVWPTGTTMPRNALTVARPGQNGGLVTVPVGADGMVSLQHSTGMSHLVADVVGYYRAPGLPAGRFHPTGPERMLPPTVVAPSAALVLDVGAETRLDQLTAAMLSVTVSAPTARGDLRSYPYGGEAPARASMTFSAGAARTSTVVAGTDPAGRTILLNRSSAPVTMTVDLHGVYAPDSVPGGHQFVPVRQARVVDTRIDAGVVDPLTAGRTAAFQVVGRAGVPAEGVTSVVLSGLAINPTESTTNTLWGDGVDRPGVTQLSPGQAQPGADLFVVLPGADGQVAVDNSAGTTDLLLLAVGYFR